MFRFSLRIIFAAVALVAVVLYAVINYSPWLCTACCNVLGLTLVVAAVGAIAFQRTTRAFSAGFLAMALFCTWAAFGMSERPYGVRWSFSRQLVTKHLVDWVYESVHRNYMRLGDGRDYLLFEDGTFADRLGTEEVFVTQDGHRIYPREVFETMAHCLLAIVLGLIAGTVAAVVRSIADRRRSRAASRQSLVAVRPEAQPRNEKAEVPGP
jgi:hypothetical protein